MIPSLIKPATRNTPWPEEQTEKLRNLVLDPNMTASKIAIELGDGLTRHAVIGKIHRLGLQNNIWGKGQKNGRPRKTNHRGQSAQSKQTALYFTKRKRLRVLLVEPASSQFPNVEPSAFDNAIPQEQRKTLMQLNGHTCRWPVGYPGEPNFFFCGALTDTTYCDYHTTRSIR
jgi:GcrA cell cycle regulator